MRQLVALATTACLLIACQASPEETTEPSQPGEEVEVATFAGGCFWCMQPPFDKLDGVESTVVGYTGGEEEEPTYQEVVAGQTGHVEAVEIRYDSEVISYDELLYVFWRNIDPTDDGGQFADRGDHYRTFVFYHDDYQRDLAIASRDELDEHGPFDDPIVTEIVEASTFWVAEEYHQDYYIKNPDHYEQYSVASGRAGFLEEVWGDE